jgi:nucleoside-diphosphate-sugar epimerase
MPTTSHHRSIAVVGAGGTLGRLVVALLEASTVVDRVVALDTFDEAEAGGTSLVGVTSLVHLDRWPCPTPDDGCARAGMRLVEAAAAAGVEHVVVVSSAAVYGAWPDNPVPLTEDAALRPNPGGDYALAKAETERRWAEWASSHAGATLTVLRPAQVVGDDDEQWLAVALRAAMRWGMGDAEAPAQFVHVGDLASAVVLSVEHGLDGVYNVAPEGWLEGREIQALAGTPVRLPVPPVLAAALDRWCWSRGLGGVAPEWAPYATHPWVVAGDRLRAEGWEPTHTGAETLLDSFPVTPWSRLDSKHRREVTLGGGVAVTLGLPLAVAALVRRARRRKRSASP